MDLKRAATALAAQGFTDRPIGVKASHGPLGSHVSATHLGAPAAGIDPQVACQAFEGYVPEGESHSALPTPLAISEAQARDLPFIRGLLEKLPDLNDEQVVGMAQGFRQGDTQHRLDSAVQRAIAHAVLEVMPGNEMMSMPAGALRHMMSRAARAAQEMLSQRHLDPKESQQAFFEFKRVLAEIAQQTKARLAHHSACSDDDNWDTDGDDDKKKKHGAGGHHAAKIDSEFDSSHHYL